MSGMTLCTRLLLYVCLILGRFVRKVASFMYSSSMPPNIVTSTDDPFSIPGNIDDSKQKLDGSTVAYQSPAEIDASKLKVFWTDLMGQGRWSKAPTYKKAAVLLLCWGKGSTDMETEAEVAELAKIFKEKFRYYTFIERLDVTNLNANVQMQVNAHVAGFAREHGGPENLLIVYYAGHGSSDELRGLVLSGQTSPNDSKSAKIRASNQIVWAKTEDLLREVKAHVLEIFDCCYGGALTFRGDDRLFEYLAATGHKGYTPVPGPHSFTKALIFALGALVERGEGRFTTVDLLNKIKEYPNFPKEQQPVLSDRKYPTNKAGRIMLHPLRLNTDAVCEMDEIESSPIAQQGQNMTLHFDFSEEIEENHLKVLGTTLIDMFERNTLGVYRVRWGGVEHNSAFIRAVNKLRDGLERRRSTTKSPEKPMFGAADTTEIYDLIKDKTPNSPFLAAGTVYESQQSLSTGKPASPLPSTPPTSDFAIDADSGPTTMIQKVHQQQQKEPGQQPGEASSG